MFIVNISILSYTSEFLAQDMRISFFFFFIEQTEIENYYEHLDRVEVFYR